MDSPRFETRARFEALRGEREFEWSGPGIWTCGSLEPLEAPCVAVVGTRAASAYGKRVARSLSRELSHAGCTIVSGLALGIDASAHEGALDGNGPTVGVLGGGHHRFFPPSNRPLAARMLANGAVLSSYPPDHLAHPHQFLQRNGLVAALSDAVVVVEAPQRSGALNTAGWAAGRIPVFVVPGDVDRAGFAGSHALLRDGATLARNAADILEALRLQPLPSTAAPETRTGAAGALLRALDLGERSLDDLIESTAEPAHLVLAQLALLELDGIVECRGPERYARLLH